MTIIIYQNAGVAMERRATVDEHSGAFGWKALEWLSLARRRKFPRSQTPIKPAERNTQSPHKQIIIAIFVRSDLSEGRKLRNK